MNNYSYSWLGLSVSGYFVLLLIYTAKTNLFEKQRNWKKNG